MTVAALRFTETARAKIVKAGGKCMTLDQLVMTAPTGKYSLKETTIEINERLKQIGAFWFLKIL